MSIDVIEEIESIDIFYWSSEITEIQVKSGEHH